MAGSGAAEASGKRDRPPKRQDRHGDHDREADKGGHGCRRVLVVLASPLVAVLVGAWLAFGAVVRLGPTAVAAGGVAGAWLAWLGLAASSSAGLGPFAQADAATPLVWGECFTLLVVTCTVACCLQWGLWAAMDPAVTRARRGRRRAGQLLLALAATLAQAMQVVDLDAAAAASAPAPSSAAGAGADAHVLADASTSGGLRRLLYAACLLLPWLLLVAGERLWLPATPDDLRASEHRVLARHVASPWTTRTCQASGVHSIEVGAHVRPRAAERRCSCGGEAEADVLRLLGHDASAASASAAAAAASVTTGVATSGRGGEGGEDEPFVAGAAPPPTISRESVARGSGVAASHVGPGAGAGAGASDTERTRLTSAARGPGAKAGPAPGPSAASASGSEASLTGVSLSLSLVHVHSDAGGAGGGAGAGGAVAVAVDSGDGEVADGDGDGDGDVAVLLHGYGMGAALWCFCLDSLARTYSHVIAVDWPGTGRSARHSFEARSPEEAEDWFVRHLEAWRATHPLLRDGRRFTLVAHSLGAVIATAYLEAHPQFVRHLVLASPAGVPHPPERTATPRLLVFRLYHHVWARLSPFALVRAMGPLAPLAVGWAVRARVAWMPEDSALARDAHLPDIAAYSFHNWCLRASGERALSTMLLPGVWARGAPLCERLVPERPVLRRVPLSFVYGGDFDWMTSAHGERVCERLRRAARPAPVGADAAAAALSRGEEAVLGCAAVLNVEDGGHQLYINQPGRFCDAMRRAKAQAQAAAEAVAAQSVGVSLKVSLPVAVTPA